MENNYYESSLPNGFCLTVKRMENEMKFVIERACKAEAGTIIDIIWKVWEEIEQKQWFVVDPREYTQKQLMEGISIAYKAVEKATGEIAGVFIVLFPGTSQENLGNDIGLGKRELERVAHMESAAILSNYRGNGLQYQLMHTAEEELRKMGYCYLMCTVHPDNQYSKNNIIRQGYEVVKTGEKYGGYMRNILLKRL